MKYFLHNWPHWIITYTMSWAHTSAWSWCCCPGQSMLTSWSWFYMDNSTCDVIGFTQTLYWYIWTVRCFIVFSFIWSTSKCVIHLAVRMQVLSILVRFRGATFKCVNFQTTKDLSGLFIFMWISRICLLTFDPDLNVFPQTWQAHTLSSIFVQRLPPSSVIIPRNIYFQYKTIL